MKGGGGAGGGGEGEVEGGGGLGGGGAVARGEGEGGGKRRGGLKPDRAPKEEGVRLQAARQMPALHAIAQGKPERPYAARERSESAGRARGESGTRGGRGAGALPSRRAARQLGDALRLSPTSRAC